MVGLLTGDVGQAGSGLGHGLSAFEQVGDGVPLAIDEAVTPHHWLLRIERESLNQGPTRERLVAALSEAGVSVTLGVELGLVQDTPAKRIAFANAERLEAARHVMMNDPFVEQMMRDFGGTIVPGTLKPVDAA